MDLQEYRKKIDKVDEEILRLFKERMEISGQIARVKQTQGLPLLDIAREREKLETIRGQTDAQTSSYANMLYMLLFELSRAHQGGLLQTESALGQNILETAEHTERVFPRRALVACQGAEGAYSQVACDRIFAEPNILYCTSFEGVFSAVRDGLCQYGVLPLENSTAGSVNMVYDLMMRHDFKIVRSARIKIDHNLLAKPGVKKEDVREIFSHEQAIQQCAEYLKGFGKNVKITAVASTAEAAKIAAESGRNDVAALASRSCCELYGLRGLESSVQDKGNNYTRFICVSKNLEIYPGAERTSVMLTTAYKPGSLYRVLALIYTLGVNLVKLESRPLPDRDFQFMFYFDLEISIYSENFGRLIRELESVCEEFYYLGSYAEIL